MILSAALTGVAQAHTLPDLPPTDEVVCDWDQWDEACELWYPLWVETYLFQYQPDRPIFLEPSPSPPRTMGTNVEQWRPLVTTHFGDLADTALCLIGYESGGNPDAKNPTSSARGLFQILASLWSPHFGVSYDDLYLPDVNVALARKIYDIQGWNAWNPYKRGLCH